MGDPIKVGAEIGDVIRDVADVDMSGMLEIDEKGKRHLNTASTVSGLLTGGAFVASSLATALDEVGKEAAVAPLGIASSVVGTVCKGISGGVTAHKAQKAIAALEQAYHAADMLPDSNEDRVLLMYTIDRCIGKQRVKRNKGIANATLVGQPLNTLYRAGKAAWKFAKRTKGVHRRENAQNLMGIAKKQGDAGKIARDAIKAIIDQNYEEIATKALEDAMKSG